MSTRAFIVKENKNGSYTYVYHHFDGYPSGLGLTLYSYFNLESKVDKILELGDLSKLYEKLYPDSGQYHSFREPADDVTIAYGRDRGEEDTQARNSNTIPSFDEAGVDYIYLFSNNKWYVKAYNGYTFLPLKLVLESKGII